MPKKRARRKPIKYEFKPGWKFVRERLKPPSVCAKSSYRTITSKNTGRRGPPKGVQVISCCPKGYKRDKNNRCVRRGKTKPAITQALRHTVARFKKRHASVWRQLQEARIGAGGIRTVDGRKAPTRRPKAKGKRGRVRGEDLFKNRRLTLSGIASGRKFGDPQFTSDSALKAHMSMQAGPGYKTGASLDAPLAGLFGGVDHETLRRAKSKVDEASTILRLAMQKR
jgi:hypothetical protein